MKTVKKRFGVVLLLVGSLILLAGIVQYAKSRTPDACVAGFAKALGGNRSMRFEESVLRTKSYAIAGISVGMLLTVGGGVLFVAARKGDHSKGGC